MANASLTPTLEKNLRALAVHDGGLVERLLEPCAVDHVILSPDGPPLVRHHGALLEMGVLPIQQELGLAAWPVDAPELLLFGLGLGEVLAHVLRRRPEGKITAFERDPWLMRETLSRWDYSPALESGRLRLALGVDLALDLERLAALPRYEHPALGEIYRQERLLLENPSATGPWAAVGLGGHLVDELAEALQSEGYRPVPVELSRWSPAELASALKRLNPELVVAINSHEGLEDLCQKQDRTLFVWEIDPSPDRQSPPSGKTHLFTCQRKRMKQLAEMGCERVTHLPLAADPVKRQPLQLGAGDAAHYESKVCFVGSSLAQAAQEYRRKFLHLYASWLCGDEADFAQGEASMEEILVAQRRAGANYCIPQLAAEEFSEFLEAARITKTRQDPVSWLAEIAAAEKRQRYVGDLGQFGVRVWGDEGWASIDALGGRYMGRAEHHEELTRIYSSSTIHVDVNRLYQPDVISHRVFEVLACGGFLLTEHTDELTELFGVGLELETYRNQGELHEKVEYFLARPDEASSIAARGREAVLQRHTLTHRVRTMLAS